MPDMTQGMVTNLMRCQWAEHSEALLIACGRLATMG